MKAGWATLHQVRDEGGMGAGQPTWRWPGRRGVGSTVVVSALTISSLLHRDFSILLQGVPLITCVFSNKMWYNLS